MKTHHLLVYFSSFSIQISSLLLAPVAPQPVLLRTKLKIDNQTFL